MKAYFDNNATTRPDESVVAAMMPYFTEKYHNASGVYEDGQNARQDVENARKSVAKLLNANDREIIFTSGGTESDNLAIKGAAAAHPDKKHIITSAIEHHAVLNACKYLEKQGYKITYVPVNENGAVDPETVKKAIQPDTLLISVMHANNETGVIQPIEQLGRIAREHKVLMHTDAVQTAGKIPINVNDMSADLLSISAHKFHGPKGVGALYVRKGIRISPLFHGGHHEFNKRAGTENVPGIIGMAAAAELAIKGFTDGTHGRIRKLRDMLEDGLIAAIPEIKINGPRDIRIDNTVNISVKYIEGEGMLIHMDFEGIAASSGSACTSGSLDPSHVLLAMGLDHGTAHGSIRFSLSRYSTEEEVKHVLKVLPPVVEKLRAISPFWNKEKK